MIEEIDTRDDDLMIKYLVQKSLPLFSLWESHLQLPGAKLLDVYLAKINSKDESTREVTFYKKELEEILGRERINASELKPVLNSLMDKYSIAEIANGKKQYVLINLFELCRMEYDENGVTFIRMKCSETAKKYFFNIEALKYRKYDLKEIAPLKSIYTYNMFLILQLYRWNKSVKLTLNKFREMLGVVKSKEIDPKNKDKNAFQEFKRFNDLVLKVVQQELAERINYKFDYEPIKIGNKVVSIRLDLSHLPKQGGKETTITYYQSSNKATSNKQTLPPPSNPNPSCQEATKAKNEKSVETKKWNRKEKPIETKHFARKNKPIAAFEYKKLDFDIRKLINRREDESFDDCDEFKEKLRV